MKVKMKLNLTGREFDRVYIFQENEMKWNEGTNLEYIHGLPQS
jgi:hypothetical protein